MIDLKNNNINSDGAYIISRILEVNKNLLSLDLKWNEIGGKGAEMILEGLEKNTLLKNLDLSCNKIPEEMIAEVSRILTRNRRYIFKRDFTFQKIYLKQLIHSLY